jgi:two-component system nitrogen regulation sensor histidine kinase GlnL
MSQLTFGERLWASLPVPTFLLDPGNVISEVNPAAESFMNRSVRGLKGASMFDVLAIDAPFEDSFDRVRRDQATLFMNTVDVGTGERPPVECDVQIASMMGMPGFLLVMFEPREIKDRLGRAHSVKTAAQSAIGMSEMLAHEIKNPLAGITGAAQLLSMNLEAEDQDLTDLIVEESRRIVKLLDQVEQFGNLSPPDRKPVNIHDLLDRARKSASVGFAAHMKITEDYDPSLPSTFVDGDQMLQVFLNLMKNAAEASDGQGELRLRTFYDMSLRLRRKDKTAALPLQVEISDNGPGIPEDIAAHIFEPFVSGRENGTGLGLALVSKIISDHDGWVAVDSGPGRTTFRISLPIAPKPTGGD